MKISSYSGLNLLFYSYISLLAGKTAITLQRMPRLSYSVNLRPLRFCVQLLTPSAFLNFCITSFAAL